MATELGIALARRGHEIHFVSHTRPFRLHDNIPNVYFHRVEITDYPLFRYPPYAMALAGQLVELTREHQFDFLHVHYAVPLSVSAFLCQQALKDLSPPVIVTMHGTDVTIVGAEKPLNVILKFVISEKSDYVTTVSKFLRDAARLAFDLKREIAVIPNFADTTRFHPDLRTPERRRRLAPGNELLIGHMSNFRPVKRIPDVIEVFSKVIQSVDARLVMIGGGSGADEARKRVRAMGLEDRVVFTGAIQNVEEILAQLDLFLLPSETESFGLAALEAMACGVPCITTDAGGLPEVISHGVEGFQYPVGAVEQMVEAAVKLLSDEGMRTRMGAAARARAVDEFDVEVAIAEYEKLYYALKQKSESVMDVR